MDISIKFTGKSLLLHTGYRLRQFRKESVKNMWELTFSSFSLVMIVLQNLLNGLLILERRHGSFYFIIIIMFMKG